MRAQGPALLPSEHDALLRGVRRISWVTLAWLLVDGAVGMTAGITANSVVLIGWGVDCAIEAAASLALIWRFTGVRVHSESAERLAQRIVGASFFLLAPYIAVEAIDHLVTGNASRGSWIGVGLAAADVALMPLFGRAKKRMGDRLHSPATAGGGKQNVLCAYLSLAVLLGLGANVLCGWWWADPAVALLVATVVVRAGLATWRGQGCGTGAC